MKQITMDWSTYELELRTAKYQAEMKMVQDMIKLINLIKEKNKFQIGF